MNKFQITLLFLILSIPAPVFSQGNLVNMNSVGMELHEILSEIRTQTGYDYILSDDIISPDITFQIYFHNASVHYALNQIFKNLDATYTIKEKTIIIIPKKKKNQSNKTIISGHIYDSKTKKAIPFATVTISDSYFGVVSNEDGSFSFPISLKDSSNHLKIRCVGYNQLNTSITNLNSSSIKEFYLTPANYKIDEVVVKGKKIKIKSAPEIVTLAINRIKTNYPNQPFLLKGYYRDYLKINKQYENLYEAAVEVNDMGFNTSERENTKIGLIYGAINRTFPVDSTKIINYGKKKIVPHGTIEYAGTNEFNFLLFHNPIRNYQYESFDYIRNINSDFLSNHNFHFEGMEYIDSTPCYHISIKYDTNKNQEFTGSATTIMGSKPIYSNYKATGHIYIQTGSYEIHNFSYQVYYNKIKLWDLNLEYRQKNGLLFLNYLSFNNLVEFPNLNSNSFRLNNTLIDKEHKSVKLFFNAKVDSLSAFGRRNYNLEFDGNRLNVHKIEIIDSCIVLKIKHFDRILGFFEPQYANRLNIKLKHIKDNSGNELNKAKITKAYQYREFFVNDASIKFQPIPKEQCIDARKSMIYFMNTIKAKPNSITFNSPLLH